MWAQSWTNIYSLVAPYPNKTSIDVANQMEQQVKKSFINCQVKNSIFNYLLIVRVTTL